VTVAPAKFQVELFFGAKLFADHFLRLEGSAWSSSVPAGVSNQADTVTLTVQSGQSTQNLYASFTAFSSATVKYLVGRCTELDATNFVVAVQKSSDSNWVTAKTGTAAGRFVVDVSEIYSGNIKGIRITVNGSPDDYGIFDYLVLCESTKIWDYSGDYQLITDIVGKATVTKSLINDEVNSASFTVKDFSEEGDTYTALTDYGYGIIWVSRDEATLGTVDQKLFGGRIADINQNYLSFGNADITFTLYGHASELTDSPELVYQLYAATNGRTIIEEALALCKYLAKYPHAVGWFDYTGQISDVDDRIADDSTHSVEYDEVQPMKAIVEILDKSHNPSDVIGFDMYETPSGVLVGHLRNSLDFICPVSPTLKAAIKKIDFHRIVNRQKVYGANGKEIPSDESWTESTTGWTTVSGTLDLEETVKNEGTYSLSLYTVPDSTVLIHRDISDYIFGFGKRAAKTVKFWRRREIGGFTGPNAAQIELWAPDSSNYFYAGMKVYTGIEENLVSYTLGKTNEYDAELNQNGEWKKEGTPNWSQITKVAFRITRNPLEALGVFVDSLRFCDLPFSNFYDISEDTDSITNYNGVREGEPIVDQTLGSDAECKKKGDAIIAEKKDPTVTIEPFTVDGDARYNAGDIMTDGGSNFRIISVEHILYGSRWDATITVSEAP